MVEYQVKYSEASQFFSQTPCGYLVGFPSLFLVWFIPQSQLVFAIHSVGGKACEKVLTALRPSQAIFFSELSWMWGGNSSPNQQHIFRPLLLLLFCQADLHQEIWAPGEGSSADWASGLILDLTDVSNNYKPSISTAILRVSNKWSTLLRDWCSGCSAPWLTCRISDSCQFRAAFTSGLFSGSQLRLPVWMHLITRGRVQPPNPSTVVVNIEHQMRLAVISSRHVSHKMR